MFSGAEKTSFVLLLLLLTKSEPAAASCGFSSIPCTPPACVCRSGRQLTSVPQDLPDNTTALILEQNWIQAVHQANFSRYGSLEALDLSYNSISRIDSGTFVHLTELTRLELSGNGLNTLSANAFAGLGNLVSLGLSANHLTSLVGTMFAGLGSLTQLYLNGNPLSTIQDNPFATLGSLTVLNLHQNLLTGLKADMFGGLSNLETLTLDYNQIVSIESDTFRGNGKLKRLSLTDNKISTIPDNTFAHLYQVVYMQLSENHISEFNVEAFRPDITWWSLLEMEDNRMETLPAAAYDLLASFAAVTLGNNPWQCDCRMAPFKQRMNGTHAFESQIVCAGPDNLAGKSLLHNVSVSDMVCAQSTTAQPDTTPTASSVQGSTQGADSSMSSSTPRNQAQMTKTNAGTTPCISTLLVFLAAFLGQSSRSTLL
ncbi:carboxypeptidase N subunit 2-like [Branchiostoma lanceolatum]|uniref:carboxypeptidase N subunit 2-like n=1 Tax=Branchiostoma lanceolatum TaxID=7740 RepID=UPI003456FEBF